MTALAADRNTPERDGNAVVLPVAASTKIFAGALVLVNASGNAVKGATATGLKPVGRAAELADNSAGSAGDISVRVRRGIFRFANSAAADLIDQGDIGSIAYVVDDQTVALTDGTGSRSPAGRIVDVDAQGVWIDTRLPVT